MRIFSILLFFIIIGCNNESKSTVDKIVTYQQKDSNEKEQETKTNQRTSFLFQNGFNHYMVGDYMEAIKYYSMVLELSPLDKSALEMRSTSKEKLGDYYGALEDLNCLILQSPDFPQYYWDRARINGILNKNIEVKEDYLKILHMDEKSPGIHYYKALTFDRLGNFNAAIDELNKNMLVLSFEGFENQSYFLRGLLKIKIGQKEDGCKDLSKAGELGYKDAYELIRKYCN